MYEEALFDLTEQAVDTGNQAALPVHAVCDMTAAGYDVADLDPELFCVDLAYRETVH